MVRTEKKRFSPSMRVASDLDVDWSLRTLRSPDEIVPTLDSLIAGLQSLGYSARDQFAIRLALEEGLVNAIKHGHGGDCSKQVRLRYHFTADRVLAQIEDEGSGFDPEDVPDPLAWENLERPCGRGLLLMRNYVTWMRYNETGNCVTLCRQRTGT